ncbi:MULTISPECIES: hypothetical protein [Acinetobacter]|uniref:Uncharacterized protein n=1 Tax=Acinetobacter baumannii TaxID=470 RepID=A0ABD5DBD4_ACIBA|nr:MULTISPECIES: hypothetical protein [Acinetobacter]EHU2760875.1 hypothetical protein [Acinetobacter baumannii]EHU3119826.1 hypothetical protein [Acinetobacter baumannii]EJB8489886.1 hypothetical protein [Acinetobacter baumannii]EKV7389843.1 hypothetical protein [Acinetobacter baumannii]EKW3202897.1 hypothetical protein [Acinetobacter baumannii]
MIKKALTADSLSGLVNTGDEPKTTTESAAPDESKYFVYKHDGKTYLIDRKHTVTGSKQVSVKMDPEDYAMLRHSSDRFAKHHKDIFLEAFDLWIKHNAEKLK